MSRALQKYLDHVMIYANRKQPEAEKIRLELEDHLRQKTTELEARGLSGEDAVSQAIKDHGSARTVGYGLRKGFASLDIRTEGTARGFIAIGPRAVGVFAFGNVAVGLFAFGNVSLGFIAFGVVALAGAVSVGGLSLAPLGAAVGLAAAGQVACGLVAGGGLAVGLMVPWAVEHVGLLEVENGFWFLEHFRSSSGNVAFLVICLWFFMVFPLIRGMMWALMRNEYLRIKKADPDIDVSVAWP
ncbi:MAG: permease prefix domain 1-containing protein [Planctomycetota bacterium]|jgi:hypothetical protein